MFLRRILPRLAIYYAVLCVVLAVFLGHFAFHPQRVSLENKQQAQAAIAGFNATLREVDVAAPDGALLNGWFLSPAARNGDAVIVLHGVDDNRQGMLGFAEMFLAHGYTVLLPDSRAQGTSGGMFVSYGVKEANDVRAWVEWLLTDGQPRWVYGMGESMGAAILLQSLQVEHKFCAAVAESSFASFRDIAFDRVGQIFHTGPWLGETLLRPAVEAGFLYGRVRYGVNLADASPEHAVENVNTPILLIHGLADDNIPPRHSRQIHNHNPQIVLWEVPRAGHCGAVAVAPEEFSRRVLQRFETKPTTSAPELPPT